MPPLFADAIITPDVSLFALAMAVITSLGAFGTAVLAYLATRDKLRYDAEIVAAQENVADAYASLSQCIDALHAVRKDDERARRDYKRAVKKAVESGVSPADLPGISAPVSKMADLAPGIGEQGWPSRYGRG